MTTNLSRPVFSAHLVFGLVVIAIGLGIIMAVSGSGEKKTVDVDHH